MANTTFDKIQLKINTGRNPYLFVVLEIWHTRNAYPPGKLIVRVSTRCAVASDRSPCNALERPACKVGSSTMTCLRAGISSDQTPSENINTGDMVPIPGGTFRMGSDHHYPEEAPAHRVTVDEFWIDQTPVTNRQFKGLSSDRPQYLRGNSAGPEGLSRRVTGHVLRRVAGVLAAAPRPRSERLEPVVEFQAWR